MSKKYHAIAALLSMVLLLPGIFAQAISRRTPVVDVAERVGPAIVNISTERLVEAPSSPFDDFFNDFFGRYQPPVYKARSLGSGVIIDPQGFIITNEHVIRRASKITAGLADKRAFTATVLASDTKNDLALLKIESDEPLPSARWGNSSDILIGETVIALGNPFGLQNTVTSGVVSATNRSISLDKKEQFDDFIQTDAAINPGNSGGALLNIYGQLIGINTAIASQGQGLGFAIPVKRVRQAIGRLLDYQKLKRILLGVELEETDTEGLSWKVQVTSTIPNSSAAKAGIRAGDVVVGVDTTPIECLFDFNKAIYLKNVNDTVTVRVRTEDKTRTVSLRLAPRPLPVSLSMRKLGIAVIEGVAGVLVEGVRPNSSAERVGMQVGDMVVALGGYAVRTVQEFEFLVQHLTPGTTVSIVITRDGRRLGGNLVIE